MYRGLEFDIVKTKHSYCEGCYFNEVTNSLACDACGCNEHEVYKLKRHGEEMHKPIEFDTVKTKYNSCEGCYFNAVTNPHACGACGCNEHEVYKLKELETKKDNE